MTSDAGESFSCTISVGIAGAVEGAEEFDVTMRRADAALYRAKRSGRNRIVCATDEDESPDGDVTSEGVA